MHMRHAESEGRECRACKAVSAVHGRPCMCGTPKAKRGRGVREWHESHQEQRGPNLVGSSQALRKLQGVLHAPFLAPKGQ